jgi:hypothetical protein
MKTLSYNVGDLKRAIKESTNEFKAKLGPNVESENKRNNRESYKKTEENVKKYDGGLEEPKKKEIPPKTDRNATMLDLNPVVEPSKEYKDKVESQLKGFTSPMEENNGIVKGGATFDKDGKLGDYFKGQTEERNKEKEDLESSGLVGRVLYDKDKNNFKKHNLTNIKENMKTKRLIFKNTRFMNESQMFDRIPEEYKVDGQKIYMKDGYENEYIVECAKNEMGVVETNIVSYDNKNIMNEQVDRIFNLFLYNDKKEQDERNYHTNLNENEEFKNLMDVVRNKELIK